MKVRGWFSLVPPSHCRSQTLPHAVLGGGPQSPKSRIRKAFGAVMREERQQPSDLLVEIPPSVEKSRIAKPLKVKSERSAHGSAAMPVDLVLALLLFMWFKTGMLFAPIML